MIFSSSIFWGLFTVLVFLDLAGRLIVKSAPTTNSILLISSFTFYWIWDGTLAILLALVICQSYLSAVLTSRTRSPYPTVGSVVLNLVVLGYFKYSDFFLNDIGRFGASFSASVVIPIGLSFYIFQAVSFNVDVLRGLVKPDQLSLLKFALYISFFPQIAAGPIERYSVMESQFSRVRPVTHKDLSLGLEMIVRGAFLKFAIADPLGPKVEKVFDSTSELSSTSLCLGLLYFGIQIFSDFAGYSLMAAGTARVLGVHLTRNFGSPYFVTSLRRFWQHWHISLSRFFRDYVYVPLGGNRVGSWRITTNVLVTFALSGLWHGAGFTFVLWGLLHGVALIVERGLNTRPGPWTWLRTQLIVFFGWILFRSGSVADSVEFVRGLWQIPGRPEIGWSGAPLVLLFFGYELLFGVREGNISAPVNDRHKVLLLPILLCLVLGAWVGPRSDFVYLRF